MARENLNELFYFIAVAREGSFTRAAAQLGMSQSALSQAIRDLEARLGVQLLYRTTRSVAPTETGNRLLAKVAPRLEEVAEELAAVRAARDKPAGSVRISAPSLPATTILVPKLAPLLSAYPDIKVEINTDHKLIDIVEQRFDAGVRLGDHVAKDMIATRIGPDLPIAVVASPAYLARHRRPARPQDLVEHRCINVRLPSLGQLHVWEFRKGRQQLNVRVDGQMTVNAEPELLKAAEEGVGLAYVWKTSVDEHLRLGTLQPVLEDWCPTQTGFHLYYPSRQQSAAFALVVETLRYKASR